jgi:endonuclease/exonuclease/phosphatase (EEP) superfamily protein YafD
VKLRVMTANLWWRKADPAALARCLEAVEPDVLAVQELGHEQAEAIASVLPHGRLEPRLDYEGMGIALRRPTEVNPLSLERRNGWLARLAPELWPGLDREVEVVNVHVLAPHAFPFWRTLQTRRDQVRGLARWLDENPHAARVVCGDLNATPAWPAYRRIAERLTDVVHHHAAGSGARAPRTWGPWHGAPRMLRIDHVFASGGQVLDVRHLPIVGSDHTALVVDFEL